MKLKNVELEKEAWISKGYQVGSYNRQQIKENTLANPTWIHFGAGNLFRAYQAVFQEKLLNEGIDDTGIIAVGGRNGKNVDDYFTPFDSYHIAITLKASGDIDKKVVGSIVDTLKMDEKEKINELFAKESLQVASFTITEKGYRVSDNEGDFAKEPEDAQSYMGIFTSYLYYRYTHGAYPLTLVSMDNCSHNGDVLKAGVMKYVKAWNKEGFQEYVENKVAFPISMIDKITPRPAESVAKILEEDGVEDLLPTTNALNCFSNAEETEYLVIEDNFVNGRPHWDDAGVIFTDRETVDKVEKMKVCTCLNPIHTALAVFGNLLGYTLIYKEMENEDLVKLVNHVGYDEGLPVVVDPGILNPREFIDTVLQKRVTNPYMPDAPQRIGMDTSQKIPVRYGETLKAYQAKGYDLTQLTYIPLVFGGWLRYLMGIDDEGNQFEIPSDPLLPKLCPIMQQFQLGDEVKVEDVQAILTDASIFGVDLIEAGLADKVVGYLNEMLVGPKAVANTLHKYV